LLAMSQGFKDSRGRGPVRTGILGGEKGEHLFMNTLIDEEGIVRLLKKSGGPDRQGVRDILAKAQTLAGLNEKEVACLMTIEDAGLLDELFAVAQRVKEEIYGRRLVLFAPLYISNLCRNECIYCAFRKNNRAIQRRYLSQKEIADETKALLDQGHKRILVVAGESYPEEGFRYILDSIETIYKIKSGRSSIRRINANVAPLNIDEFRALKTAGIGTYQLFQETYHRETYRTVHLEGKKTDYHWRLTAPERAMEAGINDVGIGFLLGLYDWKFETLALLQHIRSLEVRFGVGPHTISVPRLEPATGAPFASNSPYKVSDEDFLKIVAILRCAIPYTGLIMSTRETPEIRRRTFALGVSQISAGSRTDPGGYGEKKVCSEDDGQFYVGDHRPLDEVISDVASLGYIPSFCTACYRLGRTGADFMDLARPGDIKAFCEPNACATFAEYLEDYASPSTKSIGYDLLEKVIARMEPHPRGIAENLLTKIKSGQRDCYC
jgi:2-iminoacetate synthase